MEHTTGQIIEFIEKAFGPGTTSNAGLNLSVVCPKCLEKEPGLTKRKLVVRTDDFLSHCWKCNYRSTNLYHLLSIFKPYLLAEYQEKFGITKPNSKDNTLSEPKNLSRKLENLFETQKEEIEVSVPAQLPEGFTLLATNLGKGIKSVEESWKYLQNRGLTKDDLWYWKFGITDHKPTDRTIPNYRFRVIVPSYDSQGNLNYFSARSYWNKLFPKYSNPATKRESIIFNELNIDWKQELTIVEGVFDMVKCNQNVTCLLGSTLTTEYLLFRKIVENNTPILLALDDDVVFKTSKLAKLLSEYGIKVRIFKLPKEVHDVGQMTKADFLEYQKLAANFEIKNFLQYKLESL